MLIGEVRYQQMADPGESVEFEVLGIDHQPLEGFGGVVVRIDGVTGARQFLQFATPGTHDVLVTAAKRGEDGLLERESKTVTITVGATSRATRGIATEHLTSAEASLPLLCAVSRVDHPYQVGFSLIAPSPAFQATSDSELSPSEQDAQTGGTSGEQPLASTSARSIREAEAHYEWDFGDGTVVTTPTPYLQHDFEDSLDPDREQKTFHVTVNVVPTQGTSYEVKRSLSVLNAYALCKRFGTIVPQVHHEVAMRRVEGGYEAVLAVKNVEPFPLTLTTRRVQALLPLDDPGYLQPPELLEPPVQVPAGEAIFVAVSLAEEQAPESAAGVTIHLGGEAEAGMWQVRVEAALDLPPRGELAGKAEPTSFSLFPGKLSHTAAARQGDITARSIPSAEAPKVWVIDSIPVRELRGALAERFERLVGALEPASPSLDTFEAQARRQTRGVEGPCLEDQECDPTTADPASDCRCLFTTDQRKVTVPGRIINARKGDIVLLAGGVDSIVGNMLRRVTPAQYYDHCVMVTKDPHSVPVAGPNEEAFGAQEITHNTVCFDRLLDPTFWEGEILGQPFPLEGIREDVLKYIWPGVITQTTHDAVNGEKPFVDPETGKTYELTPMNLYEKMIERQGQWEITPPIVMKPDPLEETEEIRHKLHKIAEDAHAQTGKVHYRLYGYTNAEIVDTPAPDSAKWAAGTSGSMCSSFLWDTVRRNGGRIEGSLEENEKKAGIVVKEGAPDGLYHYDEAERLEAGQYVASYVEQQVMDAADGMVPGASSLPVVRETANKVANQVVNTFASDEAGKAGLSDAWKRPGEGTTVSPDDLLLWDPPRSGGLFGHCTPALYRPSYKMSVSVYRWARISGTGSVGGTVRYHGSPVEQAAVTVPGAPTTYTDSNGHYRFDRLSVGTHELTVTKTIDGLLRVAHEYAHVATSENQQDVELKTPWRKLSVSGSIHWDLSGGQGRPNIKTLPVQYEANLGSVYPYSERTLELSGLRDARLTLKLSANWTPEQTLSVKLTYTLHRKSGPSSDEHSVDVLAGDTTTLSEWGSSVEGLSIDISINNIDT
jgi:hypothetical protein